MFAIAALLAAFVCAPSLGWAETNGRRGALANAFLGVLGALVAGFIMRAVFAGLGYENLHVAGVAGALFGTCAVVFDSHALSRRHA